MSVQPAALLYREFFTREEQCLLDSTPVESALSEIYLYRHLLRRLLAALRHKPRLSLKSQLQVLAAIGNAGLILAALVRFHWHTTERRGALDPELLAFAAREGEPL